MGNDISQKELAKFLGKSPTWVCKRQRSADPMPRDLEGALAWIARRRAQSPVRTSALDGNTQAEIARLLGCSQNAISAWQRLPVDAMPKDRAGAIAWYDRKKSKRWAHPTQEDLARLFGCSQKTISKWQLRFVDPMPKDRTGAIAWFRRHRATSTPPPHAIESNTPPSPPPPPTANKKAFPLQTPAMPSPAAAEAVPKA